MAQSPDAGRLADQVREHDLRLGSLIRNNPLPIVVVDANRHVQMCNPAFEQLFGYAEAEIAGRRIDEVLSTPETRQEFTSLQREAQASRASHMTTIRRKKDGSLVEVDLHIVPLTIDGESIGAYAIYRDLTAEREAERQVEEALRMKTDFVSFVTHQLRTPLSGIKWMLELAQESADPEESNSYVQDARDSADRLITLVNDLLDISRLESGKLQVTLEPVDLGATTTGVLGDIAALVRDKGHTLAVTAGDTLPRVTADAQLLRQVVLNLLSNAVKYTPAGGTVSVAMVREDGRVRWSVTDTGIGIPAEAQERLFEKFFRAANSMTMDTEGTGLGLYLVRLIVERLGGRVGCTSEEGKGTTFWFTVPVSGETR
jgi:PAS domain S-box-containing protein